MYTTKSVFAPTANYLLYQKCETFLNRRYPKARDAFDIHFLLSRGGGLGKDSSAVPRRFHRNKGIRQGFIGERIRNMTAKLCTVELRPVLPLSMFEELAKGSFESIRGSVRMGHALVS